MQKNSIKISVFFFLILSILYANGQDIPETIKKQSDEIERLNNEIVRYRTLSSSLELETLKIDSLLQKNIREYDSLYYIINILQSVEKKHFNRANNKIIVDTIFIKMLDTIETTYLEKIIHSLDSINSDLHNKNSKITKELLHKEKLLEEYRIKALIQKSLTVNGIFSNSFFFNKKKTIPLNEYSNFKAKRLIEIKIRFVVDNSQKKLYKIVLFDSNHNSLDSYNVKEYGTGIIEFNILNQKSNRFKKGLYKLAIYSEGKSLAPLYQFYLK